MIAIVITTPERTRTALVPDKDVAVFLAALIDTIEPDAWAKGVTLATTKASQ